MIILLSMKIGKLLSISWLVHRLVHQSEMQFSEVLKAVEKGMCLIHATNFALARVLQGNSYIWTWGNSIMNGPVNIRLSL